MPITARPLAAKTFTAPLITHGSWGANALGTHESTMELYDCEGEPLRGYIEWDIPAIDDGESIGLTFELRGGQRVLVDYDGVSNLPREAVALLEEAGIVVDEEFKE